MQTRRLWRRIALWMLAVLMVGGMGVGGSTQLYSSLIELKAETLRAQAEVIAAFLVADGTLRRGFQPSDAGKLAAPPHEEVHSDPSTAAARIAPILRRLIPGPQTHARVYSRDGTLLVDTAAGLSHGQLRTVETGERGMIRDAWTRVTYGLMGREMPIVRERDRPNTAAHAEVRTALQGSATSLLVIENGEEIVAMAVPIQRSAIIEGVLVLSTRVGP